MIQYVRQWLGVVKAPWGEDSWGGVNLRVVLTGSSSTLVREGLSYVTSPFE